MLNPVPRNDSSVLGHWWWTVDRVSLLLIIVLIIFGLLLVFSGGAAKASQIGLSDPNIFIRKQLIMSIPAVLLMVVISTFSLKNVKRLAVVVLGLSVVMLMGTLVFGASINGAKRWLQIAGFTIQPSEFVKPAFAVFVAWMFSAARVGEDIPGRTIATFMLGLILVLLLMQPDIGQSVLISVIWAAVFFLAGLPWIFTILVIISAGLSAFGAYYTFPHFHTRINQWLYPDHSNSYNAQQAFAAFKHGGFWGQGLSKGTIKYSLPEVHNDYIFALAGEELGIIFCLLLVVIYAVIVIRGFMRVLGRENLFAMLATSGLLVQFGVQAMINMASASGLIPPKGMTLPFISYGASSLLAMGFGMGMLLALTRKGEEE